jgi:hypothetical protein
MMLTLTLTARTTPGTTTKVRSCYLNLAKHLLINPDNLTSPPPSSTVPSRYPTPTLYPTATPATPPSYADPIPHSDAFLSTPPDLNAGCLKSTISPPEPSPELTAWPPRPITQPPEQVPESTVWPLSRPRDSTTEPFESTAPLTKPTTSQDVPPVSLLPLSQSSTRMLPSAGPSALPQALPDPVVLAAVSTRGRRLRKANVLSLNMCTCGITITESEINAGTDVMRCRVPGCETVWVCSFLVWCSSICLPAPPAH